MTQEDAILFALRELREDFRQHREHDLGYHSAVKEELDSIKRSVELHSIYWSNVFYTGKIFAWAIGSGGVLGLYMVAKAYF